LEATKRVGGKGVATRMKAKREQRSGKITLKTGVRSLTVKKAKLGKSEGEGGCREGGEQGKTAARKQKPSPVV